MEIPQKSLRFGKVKDKLGHVQNHKLLTNLLTSCTGKIHPRFSCRTSYSLANSVNNFYRIYLVLFSNKRNTFAPGNKSPQG